MKSELAEYGITDAPDVELVESATGVELPEIVDAATFVAEKLTPPPELIAGILHQGSKLAVGGGSKSFKTWTLLDLALSVSHGLPWMGHGTIQGRVLYVNFEIQNYPWQGRLRAVAKAKNITLRTGAISLWNLRGKAAGFKQLLPQIRERVGVEFSLIVLDPIYKLYGGADENKTGDIALLMNSLEDLAVTTGAAVAFGAHFAKGNASQKESIDRISGSGVFARDPDSLLMFTKHETKDCFTIEPILRNFAPVQPFVVRWDYPLMVPDDSLDPLNLKKQNGGRDQEHDPKKLLGAIANTTAENPISISQWARDAGVSRTTLQGYLEELRLKGWSTTVGEGDSARQHITPLGIKQL